TSARPEGPAGRAATPYAFGGNWSWGGRPGSRRAVVGGCGAGGPAEEYILRMSLIHTCYRITEIDRSVAFYNALGFEEIGRLPIRDEATNVFMNQPGDGDSP